MISVPFSDMLNNYSNFTLLLSFVKKFSKLHLSSKLSLSQLPPKVCLTIIRLLSCNLLRFCHFLFLIIFLVHITTILTNDHLGSQPDNLDHFFLESLLFFVICYSVHIPTILDPTLTICTVVPFAASHCSSAISIASPSPLANLIIKMKLMIPDSFRQTSLVSGQAPRGRHRPPPRQAHCTSGRPGQQAGPEAPSPGQPQGQHQQHDDYQERGKVLPSSS